MSKSWALSLFKVKNYYYYCYFLGGLAEEVDEKVLHAAFIPFGDITDIQIPLDYETGDKHTEVTFTLKR